MILSSFCTWYQFLSSTIIMQRLWEILCITLVKHRLLVMTDERSCCHFPLFSSNAWHSSVSGWSSNTPCVVSPSSSHRIKSLGCRHDLLILCIYLIQLLCIRRCGDTATYSQVSTCRIRVAAKPSTIIMQALKPINEFLVDSVASSWFGLHAWYLLRMLMMGLFSMMLHRGVDMHGHAVVLWVTMMLDNCLVWTLITNHWTLVFEASKIFILIGSLNASSICLRIHKVIDSEIRWEFAPRDLKCTVAIFGKRI